MFKHYQIKELHSSDYRYTVIAKNWHRIDNYLLDVSRDLKKNRFCGSVLFDCLLSNGSSNRFLSASFNGDSFDRNSFREVEHVQDAILSELNDVYRKNPSWIENSDILSDAKKFLMKKEFTKQNKAGR